MERPLKRYSPLGSVFTMGNEQLVYEMLWPQSFHVWMSYRQHSQPESLRICVWKTWQISKKYVKFKFFKIIKLCVDEAKVIRRQVYTLCPLCNPILSILGLAIGCHTWCKASHSIRAWLNFKWHSNQICSKGIPEFQVLLTIKINLLSAYFNLNRM